MKHIDFDDLYHIAELVIEDSPMTDNQFEQMHHISECQKCYEEFCSIITILEVTNETGMIAVRDILSDRIITTEKSTVQKVLAIISVKEKKIKEKVHIVMEQLQNDVCSLCFEAPLATTLRNVESDTSSRISKLEDIENERTFILFDTETKNLYIQIDLRNLDSDSLSAYLVMSDGSKRIIPLSQDGDLFKSKIEGVTDVDFKLVITT